MATDERPTENHIGARGMNEEMENGSHCAGNHGHRVVFLARPYGHDMVLAPNNRLPVPGQIHPSYYLVQCWLWNVVLVAGHRRRL
jgi:hypothetical protein